MANHVQAAATRVEQILTESQVAPEPRSPEPAAQWSLGLRVALRFCFVYFTLFCLSNQILGGLLLIPKLQVPDLGTIWPLRQITFWTAAHVFRVTRALVYTGSGRSS